MRTSLNRWTLALYSITYCGTRTYKTWRGSEDSIGNWAAFKTDADDSDPWAATQSRDHNLVNELTGIDSSSTHVGYDAAGDMTKVPVPGSEATSHYTCTYDAWSRMVEVKSGDNVVLKAEYDGLNRRIKKHINTSSPLDQTYDAWRHFYYNRSWQVLETRRSTDGENTHPETLQPEEQYVWSLRYIDAPVLRDRNTDTDDLCDDERLYYLADANMNVTSLVDTGGDAVERYVYDPYGKVTIYSGDWSSTIAWADSRKNEVLYCGCGMTCWRRLRDWQAAGVWDKVWHTLLDELGQADAIDWSAAAIDSCSVRALFGGRRPVPTPRIAERTARNGM